MNKELTPLEALEKIKYYDKHFFADEEWAKKHFNLIETALKQQEEINKYNVASGIEKHFDIIKYNLSEDVTSNLPEALEKVRIACLKLAMIELKLGKDQLPLKKLKALEIIKKEIGDCLEFYWDEEHDYGEVWCIQNEEESRVLIASANSKEEYELLKEVLR